MSFNDCKISGAQIQTTGVQSQADTLTGSAQANKLVFDALPTLVIQKLNSLIDQLQQQAAAGQIGVTAFEGMTAQNLQQALEELHADIGGNYGGIDGAGKVGYTPSEGVDASNVQAAIEAVQANLAAYIAKIKAATGAAEVGNKPITGMTATNVQQALEELRKDIDNIVSGVIPGGSITNDMLQGPVSVDKGGTGATTPQGALAALGAGVRPNLLDNAYFVGGGTGYGTFPVNQKGVLSGNTDRQFICDRWGQFGSEWRLTKDGLIMAKRSDAASWSFYQQIPVETLHQLVGKVVTVSVLLDSVLVTATQVLSSPVTYFLFENGERAEINVNDDANGSLQYYGSTTTRTVKAMKFEMGAGQTLAYQDADGAWHLLPQPDSDYVTQLLRCQQYLFDCGNALEDFPATMNGTWGSATVQIPIPMVKTPVLSKKTSGYGVIYTSTGALGVTNATVHYLDGNHAIISLQTGSSVVSNCVWRECAFWLDTGM